MRRRVEDNGEALSTLMTQLADPQTSPAARSTETFFAPARVNLLGEHTDYTGGFVLPMAIGFSTTASLTPRQDGQYAFASDRFPDSLKVSSDDRSEARHDWTDYPLGVLRMLQKRSITVPGFDLKLGGDVPLNSGLSSSASVEVATAIAIMSHAGVELKPKQIALLCQKAENEFVGSPCGIMDQFVVTAASAGHAMMLDTRSLAYELLPLMPGTRIVVCNSMVKHSIASGEYGVRRREVETGQKVLTEAFRHIRLLRDATLDELEFCRAEMSNEAFLRCRHIITENGRVHLAREAMLSGDAAGFGRLMAEAHVSQRDDFACSCEEIDFLVTTAAALDGCYGARLTGGGFGGCTVNLVTEASADAIATELRSRYKDRFNIAAETYICDAVDGAVLRNAATVSASAQE